MSFDNWTWKRSYQEQRPVLGLDREVPPYIQEEQLLADRRKQENEAMADVIAASDSPSILPPSTWRASAWCCTDPGPNKPPVWMEHTIELHHLSMAHAAVMMAESRLKADLGYDIVHVTRLRRIPSTPPGIVSEFSDLDQFRHFIADSLTRERLLNFSVSNTTMQSIINYAQRITKGDDWKLIAFNKLRDEGYLDR